MKVVTHESEIDEALHLSVQDQLSAPLIDLLFIKIVNQIPEAKK